ncbi:MAG TPA: DNA polymerase III subunit chi [Methylophilaceae bacterium]|nr:DNA polymerase III subunit chi [Methylophilaceae bacterium]
MTQVIFYSNITDKALALLVLVQRALAKKNLVTVTVENEVQAQTFAKVLWEQERTSFLPNVQVDAHLAKQTPVVFDWQQNQLCHDDILINLSRKQLTVFSRFRQLIELVGIDELDKQQARERFRFYRDRGYQIKHFEERNLLH